MLRYENFNLELMIVVEAFKHVRLLDNTQNLLNHLAGLRNSRKIQYQASQGPGSHKI